MRTTRSSRVLIAGTCSLGALAFTATTPASAAPYTPDALLTLSIATPLLGGTLVITLVNFKTGELIDIVFTHSPSVLTTVRADKDGRATIPITLPRSVQGNQTLTATGRQSGKTAQSNLFVGSLLSGNPVTKATGTVLNAEAAPTQAAPAPAAVTKAVAPADSAQAAPGWGAVNYNLAPQASSHDNHASAVAVAAMVGLATVGGVGFARRRRSGA
jgi:hypothetical protein